METLIINSSNKIDEIRSIFDSYKVDINLKNLLHIEDISPNTTGILITNEFEISIIKPIVEFAIKNNIKILAVERGLLSLINLMNDSSHEIDRPFTGNSSTFISLGSKLAEIIGGAGPLKTNFEYKFEIPIKALPPNYLPSSINLESGCIEAIESEGSTNILGVLWPIFSGQKIPSRFENILSWISD